MNDIKRTSEGTFIYRSIMERVIKTVSLDDELEELEGLSFLEVLNMPRPSALLIMASHSAKARECSNVVIPVSGIG